MPRPVLPRLAVGVGAQAGFATTRTLGLRLGLVLGLGLGLGLAVNTET